MNTSAQRSTGIIIILAAIVIVVLFTTSCTDSTSPSDRGTLIVQTNLKSGAIAAAMPDGNVQDSSDIDSITLTRVRILVSRIKLHGVDEDTTDATGRVVKAGPAVITWTRDSVATVFASALPVGRYDRMKLEMHKFSASEADAYRSDPVFADFATVKDRVTVIIEGHVWSDSVMTSFTLTTDRTENLWIAVDPYFDITESSTTNVIIDADAVDVFRIGGSLLHPSDNNVRTQLQTRLRTLLRLRKA
ncbi:MAG: hypothetical protein FGM24_07055 [Candidatus Kapabacteria bacterium]|nr:hypothetical protein [Candidatus Kapabacteria bacterium]